MTDAPSRSLNLAGASNFRDLGGYIGRDGRRLRWRRLFRSDNLAALSAQDHAVLQGLGLKRAFDFRGVAERAAAAYQLPGVAHHPLTIEPTVVQGLNSLRAAGRSIGPQEAAAQMVRTYQSFVRDSSDRFGELFAHLLASDAPSVFHCTAGKDRTGFAAAMILLALDVPREVAMEDFLLTNRHYRRAHATSQTDLPQEVLEVLWKVQGRYLEAALQVVDEEHGGPVLFLRKLGVGERERARLAELYLEV